MNNEDEFLFTEILTSDNSYEQKESVNGLMKEYNMSGTQVVQIENQVVRNTKQGENGLTYITFITFRGRLYI